MPRQTRVGQSQGIKIGRSRKYISSGKTTLWASGPLTSAPCHRVTVPTCPVAHASLVYLCTFAQEHRSDLHLCTSPPNLRLSHQPSPQASHLRPSCPPAIVPSGPRPTPCPRVNLPARPLAHASRVYLCTFAQEQCSDLHLCTASLYPLPTRQLVNRSTSPVALCATRTR
jgi:hypothetical protein